MFIKQFTMACAAAAVMSVPAMTPAKADSGDFAAGIVAGVIGSAVVRNANKPKRTVRRSTRSTRAAKPRISSAQRAENREVQTALNYFGFPSGSPDGVFGKKTRAAVSNYQVHLGYAATGQLTSYEKDFLLQSYRRALAGGPTTTQQIAANPLGPRGLLNTYRDQAAGVVTAAAPTVQAAPSTTTVVALQPQVLPLQGGTTTTTTTTVSGTGAAATTGAALPNFLGTTEVASLASHCNQVSLITSTNGGFTTEANIVDASFALNEQFCLARTYAIAEGEQLVASVQGFTPQQIEQQCAGFGPAMAPHVAALSVKPSDQVSADVGKFVLNSGMAPAQLAGTAKICLSVGYRTDNMDVAIGSALILSVLGEQAYGELMGHHLAQGFGVTKRADLSTAWYEMGLNAVEQGATPVFNPGDPQRSALIRKAVFSGTSQSQNGTQPLVQPAGAALPTFSIQN
ncbi:peptidoglycan-binding protein [uncultured Litoreibacter sp.]|uniref:peptidoglycan-binding domain-containing protein n=1 Tax=uncultured Litoreibacter sp. TaxID=1392394 RepID=UPI00261310DF|nr:peptidoglycan-binding protein [uncultured Litoreibacter sp.]